jgi:DNA-binding transcriptional MocR family regulator
LRVSYLLTPELPTQEEMRGRLQAAAQMPPPLMVALATHWIESGIAERITAAIRSEATGRQQLAGRALKGLTFSAGRAGHHLWLTLPSEWRRENFVAYLLRNGLAVVGSDAFAVDANAPHAVRVSLGAARNRAELVEGLEMLASVVGMTAVESQIV